MDKQRNERISIRINGKERFFLSDEELNQEISAAKEVDHNRKESDDSSNFNTFIIENLEKEKEPTNIIDFEERRNERKKSYQSTLKNFSFPKDIKKNKRRPKKTFGGRGQNPLLRNFLAVLLTAIIIGVSFGYIILALFTDMSEGDTNDGRSVSVENGQPTPQINGNSAGVPSNAAAGGSVGSTANGIGPLKMEVIQGGAFENVESATQYANQLKESGAAAVVLPESNPVLMFIGVGNNRDHADLVGDFYLEKGQEIYLKPFELYAIDSNKVGNTEVAGYVSSGLSLYQTLVQLSSQTFQLETINNGTWNDIETKFSKWNKTKPQKLPASLEPFTNSMSEAYQSLASYRIKADEQQLWNSQQALLEGLLSYKKWHDATY